MTANAVIFLGDNPTMQTDNNSVYSAIAMKDSNWYLLLNGYALQSGAIAQSKKTITGIQRMMKKLGIPHIRIRVECDDGNSDVSRSGKKDFTMKEAMDYIFKFGA